MAFSGGTMIATILKIPQGASAQGDAHFARFIKETKGIANAYQLEGDNELVMVTIWESESARDTYMKSALKREVDQSYAGQTRTAYKVRGHK